MANMALTLIGAYQTTDPNGPAALLPLAGMPLVEHQARRAAAAGATPILLLVETPSPELAAIVERLEQDGIAAELTDTIAAAVRGRDVLLLANGCLPDPRVIAAELAGPAPSLAIIADASGLDRYERIDAAARWAGVALLSSAIVAETAAMLEGWDPVSTLLRRAVQAEAARIDAGAPPLLAASAGELIGAERAMIVTSRVRHDDWIGLHLFTPIENLLLPLLLERQVAPAALTAGSAVLALLAGLAAVLGLRWPVLLALLLTGPLATVAVRLARMQSRPVGSLSAWSIARLTGGALALIGLGWGLTTDTGQWGWLLVAGIVIAALGGLAIERPASSPGWYASARTLAWEMLPFALLGRWGLGLAALALHATFSLGAALIARRADQR